MKIDANNTLKQKIANMLKDASDKNEAVYEAIDMIVSEKYSDIISQVKADAAVGNRRGLRDLKENETKFYEMLKGGAKGYKQSVSAEQIDIIPTEIIDATLADVKEPSEIDELIEMLPAGVKKWIFGGKTGGASWGALTDAITSEITANLTSDAIDVHKLSAYCLIPKSIRALEIGYVDRYFRAVLNEALEDGKVVGYVYGDGKTAPIGITKQISQVNTDGTHKNKTKVATITKFTPKGLAPALKILSNGGKRKVKNIYLLCNPLDEADYVNPALYGESVTGGWIDKSFAKIKVVSDPNINQGDGILTIPKAYKMGFSGVRITEYSETKALEDVDVLIGKVEGNGRADDDNTAVFFDITKLEEYVPTFKPAGA